MRRYRKWIVTLGILTAAPGLAVASPFSFGRSSDDADSASSDAAPQKSKNQKVAEDIAIALKKASFHGYEIDVEYKNGLATLRGKVSDPKQKARASQIVSKVPGVRTVDNKLSVLPTRPPVRQVNGSAMAAGNPGAAGAEPIATNQEKAIQIGRALQGGGLSGYDIEVLYQNGQAMLRGTVATQEQQLAAARIARSVPGVFAVSNQLRIEGQAGQPTAANASRYMMASYQPGQAGPNMAGGPQAGPSPYGSPYGPYAQIPPGAPMTPGQSPAVIGPPAVPVPPGPTGVPPMGVPMPATGPTPTTPVYDNPNVPGYAWPSYAQSPNYAAVTYPSQYSASAWPYIGPFYPYPQVPLNWRKVSLEWSDGHWDLKFDPRTDRWWWFLNPWNW